MNSISVVVFPNSFSAEPNKPKNMAAVVRTHLLIYSPLLLPCFIVR